MVKQASLDLMEVLPNFDLTTEESRYDAGILFSPTTDPSIGTSWSCSSNHDDLKEHESEQQYETMGTTDHDLLQTYRMDLGTIPGNEAKKFNLDEIRSTHTELMNLVEIFLTQIGIKFQTLKKDNFSCTSEWGTEPYGSFLITCTRTMIRGLCALFGKAFCQDAVGVCSSYTVDGDLPHTCFLITTHDGSKINFDDALKITNIICSIFPKLSSQRDETGRYMEFHDYCNECPSITNGVNKRLHKIMHDPIFTRVLTLLDYRLDDSICSLPYPMLDRFCLQILPKIHHKVEELNLESSSMARILLATNYPNLHRLSLYGLDIERAKYLFSDEKNLIVRFKNQITSLFIDFTKSNERHNGPIIRLIFALICDMFTNLQCLNFYPSSSLCQQLSFFRSPPTVFPSTLLELHVNLQDFIDCLYLLDGRFNQLHILYVDILFITSYINISKSFVYDGLIVPLLHRMVNLEKLDLQLNCERETFVNGDDLKTNIINHLLRLNTFTFNIRSTSYCDNQTGVPSNEDIQQTFKDFKYNQVISCVDCFPKSLYSQCHIYSYPYKSTYYLKITNNFSGGLFQYVNIVSLFDERPFEYEYFLQIA
ncbi:unnamed protein product [Rotaria magnacalcarata]